jgi:ribosome-associated protein
VSKISTPKNSKALATLCAKLASEKIASNIIVMDMANYDTAPADFFVLCSSDSVNQSNAITDFVLRQTKSAGVDKPKVEGDGVGDWILIDFFDVVMHVMLNDIRNYYQIEKLWSEAITYQFNVETNKLNKIKD